MAEVWERVALKCQRPDFSKRLRRAQMGSAFLRRIRIASSQVITLDEDWQCEHLVLMVPSSYVELWEGRAGAFDMEELAYSDLTWRIVDVLEGRAPLLCQGCAAPDVPAGPA